jgi:dolichol kinase
MDRGVLFRRCLHLLIALAPIYFMIPVDLPVWGLERWVLLIGFFAIVSGFEAIRLAKGWTFIGLRPHEAHHIASFVWAAAGITLALWLFREDIASAALIGMAFVDPLAGELRRVRPKSTMTLSIPMIAYFAISATALYAFGHLSATSIAIVSIIGAVTAVLVEREKVPYIDDDFLMIIAPCLLMQLFAL